MLMELSIASTTVRGTSPPKSFAALVETTGRAAAMINSAKMRHRSKSRMMFSMRELRLVFAATSFKNRSVLKFTCTTRRRCQRWMRTGAASAASP